MSGRRWGSNRCRSRRQAGGLGWVEVFLEAHDAAVLDLDFQRGVEGERLAVWCGAAKYVLLDDAAGELDALNVGVLKVGESFAEPPHLAGVVLWCDFDLVVVVPDLGVVGIDREDGVDVGRLDGSDESIDDGSGRFGHASDPHIQARYSSILIADGLRNGRVNAMRTTVDHAGRVVIPKAMLDALGLSEGGRVEIREVDGQLVIKAAAIDKHLTTTDGATVCVPEEVLPPLTVEQIRSALENIRR